MAIPDVFMSSSSNYLSTQAALTFHSNTHTQTAPLIRVQHISSLTDTLESSIRVTALLITW